MRYWAARQTASGTVITRRQAIAAVCAASPSTSANGSGWVDDALEPADREVFTREPPRG